MGQPAWGLSDREVSVKQYQVRAMFVIDLLHEYYYEREKTLFEEKVVNTGQPAYELSQREVSVEQCQGCAMFVDDFLPALRCQEDLRVREISFEKVVNMGRPV